MPYGLAHIKPGFVGFAASACGLTRLTLPQDSVEKALLDVAGGAPEGDRSDEAFVPLATMLDRYFSGDPVDFSDHRLDLQGRTAFQRWVLEEVLSIPRGEVRSYGEVAARVGSPGAARAVGAVMAANPVCIVIPCHRVVASDGGLGGFGGGLDMKRRMLGAEQDRPS